MKQPRKYDYRRYFTEKTYLEYLIRSDELEEVKLTKEEMEAINLKDVKGYRLKENAQKEWGFQGKIFKI